MLIEEKARVVSVESIKGRVEVKEVDLEGLLGGERGRGGYIYKVLGTFAGQGLIRINIINHL